MQSHLPSCVASRQKSQLLVNPGGSKHCFCPNRRRVNRKPERQPGSTSNRATGHPPPARQLNDLFRNRARLISSVATFLRLRRQWSSGSDANDLGWRERLPPVFPCPGPATDSCDRFEESRSS